MLCTGASPQRYINKVSNVFKVTKNGTCLIIESAFGFQVAEELGIGLTSPEIHVCNLEITPI